MMYLKLLIVTIVIILVIRYYIRCRPSLNLIDDGSSYHLYLWYSKYDWLDIETRTYIKIF